MTPPASFVADLRSYDPQLRVRWAVHTQRWIIERRVPRRLPEWMTATPPPDRAGPKRKDIWDGWKDSYLQVLFVDRDLLTWHHVAPALRERDAWGAGGFEALNRALDDAEAAWDRAQDKKITDFNEAAALEAYDVLAWRLGNRVATPHESSDIEPSDAVEQHDGFTVRVRKGLRRIGVV